MEGASPPGKIDPVESAEFTEHLLERRDLEQGHEDILLPRAFAA
jgi:hypothetical protein